MSLHVENLSGNRHRWQLRPALAVLSLFTLLTLFFTRPLAAHAFTWALGGDALVNVRILDWGKTSLLGGPQALLNLPHGNIFYPYRYTFFFTEHLLPTTALVLPVLTLSPSPLAALNLYTLLTFVLTGFGVWLLVTYWTGNLWVGLPAGAIVAFAPPRMLITDQPNIMTIQWMPLAALCLHRWLDEGRQRDWWLALIFVNLQTLSATNYLAHVFLILALLFGVYAWVYRERLKRRLVLGTLGLALATGIINAPAWWTYFRVSEMLNIERSLGAVHLGSAHPLNYLMATPDNLVYGGLVPKLSSSIPTSVGITPPLALFPGLVALLLTLIAVIFLRRPWSRRQRVVILALLSWLAIGFLLSLGINDQALGPKLAPYVRFLLPYRWLYDYVPGFKGLRVPARFAVLVLLALGGLTAYGILALHSRLERQHSRRLLACFSIALVGLISIEFATQPLDGEEYPYGADLPPIYTWLASSTAPEAVVLELPYSDWSYMYYLAFHKRRMVNGTSGFYPPPLREAASDLLRQFPNWTSIEWLQRLGVDYVVLHPLEYDAAHGPGTWDKLWSQMPAYLESIASVTQVGNDFALRLTPPLCPAQPDDINVSMVVEESTEPRAGGAQARLSFVNPTAAGYVSNPNLPSFVMVKDVQNGRFAFHEPLVLLPGQSSEVRVLLGELPSGREAQVTATLSNLKRKLRPEAGVSRREEDDKISRPEHSEGFISEFEGGARLLDYQLPSDELTSCQSLEILLYWQPPDQGEGGEIAAVQLIDRYGRPVIESQFQPRFGISPGSQVVSRHQLPIPGPLPTGQYTLAVRLQLPDDTSLPAHTPGGLTDRLPLASVVIRPQPPSLDTDDWQPLGASVADTVTLVAYRLDHTQLAAGDWLRLTLIWQTQKEPGRDATVFTQIIGPDDQVWGQHDNPPRGGSYPTTLWQPGELIADDYLIQVSPDAPPGRYTLIAGMYLPDTLERLPIQLADGNPLTDSVPLTTIEIGESN